MLKTMVSRGTAVAAVGVVLVGAPVGPAVAASSTTRIERQIASLTRRLNGDEATIRHDQSVITSYQSEISALQQRHLAVTFRTGGVDFGAGDNAEQALCSQGETLLGGGAGWSDGFINGGDHLIASLPVFESGVPIGWEGDGLAAAGEQATFEAYAACGSLAP